MTSVVMPTASANPSQKTPATSTFLQPSWGVMPILPKSGESGRSSSGPKHASPRALHVPYLVFQSRRTPAIRRSVAAASSSVLTVIRSRKSSGALPTRHSHFVPPSSTPHIRGFGCVIGAEYRLVARQIQRRRGIAPLCPLDPLAAGNSACSPHRSCTMHVMKLLRYGPAGREQPGMLDPDGIVRSLGGHVPAIGPEEISPAGLRRLAAIDPSSLPAGPGRPPPGPPRHGRPQVLRVRPEFSDPAG